MVSFEREDEKERAIEGARIPIKLDHKTIVKRLKYYVKEQFFIIHMEQFHEKDLIIYIVHASVNGQRQCIKNSIIQGLRSELLYLHRQNIAHEDIHSGNVMVKRNGDVKLIDFESAEYNDFKGAIDCENFKWLYESVDEVKVFTR